MEARHSVIESSVRSRKRRKASAGTNWDFPKTTRASGAKAMAEKKTGGHGPGVDTKQASDLEDARFGTYDPVAQKKSDTSRVTPSEVAQPGASMQGEPVPATPVDEFHLPE